MGIVVEMVGWKGEAISHCGQRSLGETHEKWGRRIPHAIHTNYVRRMNANSQNKSLWVNSNTEANFNNEGRGKNKNKNKTKKNVRV